MSQHHRPTYDDLIAQNVRYAATHLEAAIYNTDENKLWGTMAEIGADVRKVSAHGDTDEKLAFVDRVLAKFDAIIEAWANDLTDEEWTNWNDEDHDPRQEYEPDRDDRNFTRSFV